MLSCRELDKGQAALNLQTDEQTMFRPSLPITIERAKTRRLKQRTERSVDLVTRLAETTARHEKAGDYKAAALYAEIFVTTLDNHAEAAHG